MPNFSFGLDFQEIIGFLAFLALVVFSEQDGSVKILVLIPKTSEFTSVSALLCLILLFVVCSFFFSFY